MTRRRMWTLILVVALIGGLGLIAQSVKVWLALFHTTPREIMKWAYELHFRSKDYRRAIEMYGKVVADFPDSEEAEEALCRIGNIYHWNLKELRRAAQIYREFLSRYPQSKFASQVRIWLEDVRREMRTED
jgi:tetratricopeptide (TPR) repeat protein